jgi:hypothetical protein
MNGAAVAWGLIAVVVIGVMLYNHMQKDKAEARAMGQEQARQRAEEERLRREEEERAVEEIRRQSEERQYECWSAASGA